jgi:peptidoglycan hydrolase CwlO-like protein
MIKRLKGIDSKIDDCMSKIDDCTNAVNDLTKKIPQWVSNF